MKFTWYGKENAIIESMTPSTGTLRPDKESSKNWDDTENLYIEGDNLEVLKDRYSIQLELYEIGVKEYYHAKKVKKFIYSIALNKYTEV